MRHQQTLGQQADVRRDRTDFYTYEAEALLLAAGAAANDIITIEADSNFVLQKLNYIADIAAAAFTDSTRPIPLVTIQLTDTGSGRNLMSNPVPIPSLFGTIKRLCTKGSKKCSHPVSLT